MELKWVDTLNIALDLIDAHPEIDPQYVRFTDLRDWVLALENFNDDPERSNEKILEAIQMMWIEENN
jgi:FeS assembly protein IscX